MKIKLITLLISLTATGFSLWAQSQDTIVISPIVGNVIDYQEKVLHHIFPYYSPKIFIRAVFIRNADSSITLKTLLKPDSAVERKITKEEYDWVASMIEGTGEHSALSKNRTSKTYNTKIVLLNGERRKGVLYQVFSDRVATEKTEVLVSDIKSIKLLHPNKIGKGLGNGALIGVGVGMIFGFLQGDDPPGWFSFTAEQKAVFFGTLFSIPGTVIGGIVGATNVGIAIPINGSESKYKSIQKNLKTYSSYK